VRLLPISIGSIFKAGTLPHGGHKDPFDRLIAAQCLRHDLTLVSSDNAFDAMVCGESGEAIAVGEFVLRRASRPSYTFVFSAHLARIAWQCYN